MGIINPGEFRDLLEFYEIERIADNRGGFKGVNENFVFDGFAKVTPMKPITSIESGKMTVIQPYLVLMRYEAGKPAPDMKVLYDGEKYAIKNIVQIDTRERAIKFMMILAG
jgi:hypothetical protein